jgi:tetratricopeptide (TPR) repeat protein
MRIPVIPDYQLLRRIGGGAYGEVWLARSLATGALKAAKIVWRDKFEDHRPFEREFEGIRKFERISSEHPSQLALFHIGRNEAEGYFYYVMELADPWPSQGLANQSPEPNQDPKAELPAEGRSPTEDIYQPHTLRADLAQGRLPAVKALEVGMALTEALGHLHRHGLVHRDVKPSNVIFVNGRPKLADIGLVTNASDQCSVVGTEGYLPPEGPGTPQADIFALGKVLYEAATGLDRREFPKLPQDLRNWTDARLVLELNEIFLKACAKDPRARYWNIEAMLSDLQLLHGGKSVKGKRARERYWVVTRRVGGALAILGATAVLIVSLTRAVTPSAAYPDGPPSTNLEANAYCDKGMYILRGDNYGAFLEAYTNFNNAIARDPNFARPYVGLLEMRVRELIPGMPESTPEVMRELAQHLERLAPHLAATYCAKSVASYGEWKWPEAERWSLAAIKANPKYELGQTFYGWLLACFGRNEEVWKQVEVCRRLAPSKAVAGYRSVGNIYYLERDFTNAIAWYLKALQWQPHEMSVGMIARCYAAMGDYTNGIIYDEKAQIFQGADETQTRRNCDVLRNALAQGGVRGYWQQQWKWTEEQTDSDFYWKAVIEIHLGDTNAALDWLGKAELTQERYYGYLPTLSLVLFDHYWDGLHNDPRFKALLERVRLTKVMRSKRSE